MIKERQRGKKGKIKETGIRPIKQVNRGINNKNKGNQNKSKQKVETRGMKECKNGLNLALVIWTEDEAE